MEKLMKDYKIHKFDNGATIILKTIKGQKFTTIHMGFKAGAAQDEVAGTAHFLEHTLFLGTKNRTREQIDKDSSRITFINAQTGVFSTLVTFKRANTYFEEAFEYASDILLNTKFNTAEINKEREVVRNEIMSVKECDKRNVTAYHLALFNNYYNKTSCQVLGDDIDKVTKKELEKFRKKNYIAKNFVMYVCSALSMQKFVKLYNKYIEKNLAVCNDCPDLNYDLVAQKPSKMQVIKLDQEKIDVRITIEIPFGVHNSKNRICRYFYSELLSLGGVLYNTLRKKGLVYEYSASIGELAYNSFMTFAFVATKDNVNKVIDEISKEVQNRYKSGITKEEFANLRKQIEIFKDEDEIGYVKYLLNNVNFEYLLNFLTDELDYKKELKNATIEDVNDYIGLFNNKNNKIWVTALGNLTSKDVYDLETIKKKLL